MKTPNPALPIEMTISIASATEALEYWLTHCVLREPVTLEDVTFSEKAHFTVRINRESTKNGSDTAD